MTRKRRSFVTILAPLLLLLPVVTAQEILVFNETTGLPNCAYSCNDIYSAQFDCGANVECFCRTTYIAQKPDGWGCDGVCGAPEERGRVSGFLSSICGDEDGKDGEGDDKDSKDSNTDDNDGGDDDGKDQSSDEKDSNKKQDPQAEKARKWWKKNWPYFFLAFMLVAIAVLALAFAGPIRKYIRDKKIERRERHSGQGVPPYWEPSAPPMSLSSRPYSASVITNVRGYSYASVGTRNSSVHGLTRNSSLQNVGAHMSHVSVATRRSSQPGGHAGGSAGPYGEGEDPVLPQSPRGPEAPGIRTLFAEQAASPRQDSWERRIRQTHHDRSDGWLGRKLFPWKR